MASSFRGPALLAAAVAVALGFTPLGAFSHAAVGDRNENREMPVLGGGADTLCRIISRPGSLRRTSPC